MLCHAYAMQNLEGLLILRVPPRSALEVGPPGNVKAEMGRLKNLAVQTKKRLLCNLRQSMGELPDNITMLFTPGAADSIDVDWPQVHALLA